MFNKVKKKCSFYDDYIFLCIKMFFILLNAMENYVDIWHKVVIAIFI